MNVWRTIGWICSLGCLSACVGKGGGGECDNSTAEGYRTIVHDTVTREYILQVPSSYDSSAPASLILNFHGNGGCASTFSSGGDWDGNSNLSAIVDAQNVIVAYPQGLARAKGNAEWDPGETGTQTIDGDDVYFSEQLVAEISNEYSIDSSRVYATGYSNGGMMAYGLACSRGNIFAAVGIMSGIMLPGTCDENHSPSIIHFHGTSDDALPYEGNQDFQSVSQVIDFWLAHNNIESSSLVSTDLDGGNIQRDEYTGGTDNSSVVLYTITNGGHVWFSDDIDGTSPNQILWDFLSNYSLAEN